MASNCMSTINRECRNIEDVDLDLLTQKLKEVQKINLQMLSDFKKICDKHGLTFFLDSGTLIGAVRHQGAIPWDDDVDVAMLREDYEKLLLVIENELGEGYRFDTAYSRGEAFTDFAARIVCLNSCISQPTPETHYYQNYINKLSLEIYVLDHAPANTLRFNWKICRLRWIYGLCMSRRFKIHYEAYKQPERAFVKLLVSMGRFFKMSKLIRRFERVCQSTSGEDGLVSPSTYTFYHMKKRMQKKWFETAVLMPFDGVLLPVPVGWHEVLTTVYGNYNELPPACARTPKHMREEWVKLPKQVKEEYLLYKDSAILSDE